MACLIFALFSVGPVGNPVRAQECAQLVGTVQSLEGEVSIGSEVTGAWQPAQLGAPLCQTDSVRTGSLSRAALVLVNDEVLRLDQETTLKLADVPLDSAEPTLLDLAFGAVQSFSRAPKKVNVNTSYMTLAIRGTEFVIRSEQGRSLLTVLEGEVVASNAQGELAVPGGQSAVATDGQPPRPYLLARPLDAAQWALYYPAILSAPAGDAPELAEARRLAAGGDVAAALAALDRAAGGARIDTYRAALLLEVGQADAARAALERVLAAEPQDAQALALRAIIQVVQNQPEPALADAEKAVELAPDSTAARLALSYAQQARFDLQGARATMEATVAAQPGDALAWARLSELWLMNGDRARAREAADRAAQLSPDLERVQTVRGFADLAELRVHSAADYFQRAIALNPSDPLARFGLGLAQIRAGGLNVGRANMELAVGLDPSNALLRTYLGRAYFEERRDPQAGDQYQIAKELDPLDPTAYLFDAIRLQTTNRPVEALDQLDKSIELNDDRAIYRSRLQLDSDRAARGASLARIYQDLDFLDTGVREATNSLTYDPTNPSAHRFLSDVYGGVRRREISRVSELLQSQMLQELNQTPIPAALGETNLNIVSHGGPTTPGYNEFTPLFMSDGLYAGVGGVLGSDSTRGIEGQASALVENYSVSASGFAYDTDGWRNNAGIRHTIGDVFFQTAVTPEINAQLEFRSRSSHFGDIEQVWDPDTFSKDNDRDLDQDSFRGGLRWSPTPNSDVLLSMIYSDTDDKVHAVDPSPFGDFVQDLRFKDMGYQPEAQYIYRAEQFNLFAGGSDFFVDRDQNIDFELGGEPLGSSDDSFDITDPRGYVYGNVSLPTPVTWTVGVSADDFKQKDIEAQRVNPKFGVQWQVNDAVRLRAAAFQVVKAPLSTNRTLEPTQVAGFNQFFDDDAGVVSQRLGIGSDWQLTDNLFLGAEATWRFLDVQYFAGGDLDDGEHTNWREQTHRLYAYWAPVDRWALTAEFVYDRFSAENSELTDFTTVPKKATTYSVPLGVRYFHPSGFFGGLGVTFVRQDLDRSQNNETEFGEGTSNFTLLDAQIGYRLPKRFGIVTLQAANILDKNFDYQDDSYRESQDSPSVGPYIPQRQVMLYLTLNW
ncbi:MAG: tetratricopeptide repeat protein [Geminicoccaceae bacterium]